MRLFCIWRYYTVYVSSFSDTTNIKPSNSFYNWVYTLEQGTGLHKLWNPANVKFSNWNPKNQLYTQCKILHTVWQIFSRFYALSSEFFLASNCMQLCKKITNMRYVWRTWKKSNRDILQFSDWGVFQFFKWDDGFVKVISEFWFGHLFRYPKNHENRSTVDPKIWWNEIDSKLFRALYWHLLILTPCFHIHLCR